MIETAREALSDLDEWLSALSRGPLPRGLTSREHDVLVLLADGFTTAEVANSLSVSQHTVRSRIKGLLAKLGARNREHAVAIAIREGAI